MILAEMKQAPSLGGWIIAAAAGLVAVGVSVVLLGFTLSQAAFVGAIVLLGVGLILGMPIKALALPTTTAPQMPVRPAAQPVAAPVIATAFMAAPDEAPAAAASQMAAIDSPRRPEALSGPRGGVGDDLKVIEGIGPKMEELCHALGFYHFDQIAGWTAGEIAWVDANLAGFKGRVARDKWVAQARLILEVGPQEFLRRAKTNDY